MEDLSRLCFSCMERKDAMGVCPHCGERNPIVQDTPFLPLGGILADRYYIGEKKRRNSEGYTYIAYDIQEGRRCSVREFFPEELAVREADGFRVNVTAGNDIAFADGIDEFRDLWETLHRLRGLTSLVSVYDLFDENGTSYAVYAEPELYTLRDYLLEQRGGYIPWEEARILFMPVLSTLGTLHTAGIVHKGIDPSSFLMTGEGKLRLSGFSITQAKICYGDLEADVSDGYAPLEIYTEMSVIGPWTDIYSFTAVLYRALIGATPIASPVRAENDQMMIPAKFAERLPSFVINAIINGMQIFPDDRTASAEQLRANLSASPATAEAAAGIYRLPGDLEPEPPRSEPVVEPARGAGDYTPADALRSARLQYRNSFSDAAEEDDADRLPPRRIVRGSQNLQETLGPTAEELQEEQEKKAKTKKALIIIGSVFVALVLLVLVGSGVVKKIHSMGEGSTTSVDTYAVPNFVGMTYDAVMADAFLPTFFKFVKVEEYNASVPAGQIMNQSVAASTMANKGTEVVLHVSSGPQTVIVPDVKNMTYEQASATLTPLGLTVSQATKYNDGTKTAGIVVETTPAAGTTVNMGDTITIVVWAPVTETTTAAVTTQTPSTQPTMPTVPYITAAPTYTAPVVTDPIVTAPSATVTDPPTDPPTQAPADEPAQQDPDVEQ